MILPLRLAIPAEAQEQLPRQAGAQEQDAGDDGTEIGSGMTSYDGDELAGNRTASGERFDPDALTAAHRTLAFGSRVRVTNLAHGKSVIVRLNDRGPLNRGRVTDGRDAAASETATRCTGHAPVRPAPPNRRRAHAAAAQTQAA